METFIQKLPRSKIEITVEIPFSDFSPFLEEAVSLLSQNLKIKGFRPGKIPREIAKKELRSSEIYEKAAHLVIQNTYNRAIEQNKIKPIGTPKIEVIKIALNNPFVYKAEISVVPEVKLPDYKEIAKKSKINPQNLEVSEKELNDALVWLQKHALHRIKPVKTPARSCYPSVTLRAAIRADSIAGGKKEKQELPPLDDSFAQSLGKFENLEDLKNKTREGLVIEKKWKEKERKRGEIIENIALVSKIEIPEVLIEYEIENMIEDFKRKTEETGLKFEDYLKQIKKTKEDLKKDFREGAEKRIRVILCLREIADKENIVVSEQEIKDKINDILKKYPDIKTTEKRVDLERLRSYYRNVIQNEKIFQLLEQI